MPAERVAMRVVREVLHLTFAGISKREVAAYRLGVIDGAGNDRAFPVAWVDLAAA